MCRTWVMSGNPAEVTKEGLNLDYMNDTVFKISFSTCNLSSKRAYVLSHPSLDDNRLKNLVAWSFPPAIHDRT